MTPDDALAEVSRLLIDTNPAVYVLEQDADFGKQSWAVRKAVMARRIQLVVAPLTLTELLAKANITESELRRSTEFCLSTSEIEFRPVVFDDVFARRVGYFRRSTRAKTPDCIQFACAERLSCDAILTNDRQYKTAAPKPVILVEDIEV